MTPSQDRYLKQALRNVRGLKPRQQQAILRSGFSDYECLFVAYLVCARNLLQRDGEFNWKQRDGHWHHWLNDFKRLLDETLRYREHTYLVVTLSIVTGLLPVVHPNASLTGFKILEDARWNMLKGLSHKLEYRRKILRMEEVIQKKGMWIKHPDSIVVDRGFSQVERSAFESEGYQNIWGVELIYHDPDLIIELVSAVIPVIVGRTGILTHIAPAESRVQ